MMGAEERELILVLDESKLSDEIFVILKEYPHYIIIHKSIKEAIERAGITGIEFHGS